MHHESNRAVWSMKRRFAILSMAACVALSGVVAGPDAESGWVWRK